MDSRRGRRVTVRNKERVKLLHIPFRDKPIIVSREEHWNRYKASKESSKTYDTSEVNFDGASTIPKVMVDGEMRDFIQRGLGENRFDIMGLGGEVEQVKQTKSSREIEILRAVNTGSVKAVRAMRECMYPGLTENEVVQVLDSGG